MVVCYSTQHQAYSYNLGFRRMIWIHRSINLKYKYFNDGRITKFGRNPIPN